MYPKREIIRLAIFALLGIAPCFAFTYLGSKIGVVDVYIETYIINGQSAASFKDNNGNMHESGKEFYLQTAVKGTMGGPVRYRFYLEKVNMTSPESPDSTHRKYDTDYPPIFQSSSAEQIDSAGAASLAPEIFSKLPGAFTNPRHK